MHFAQPPAPKTPIEGISTILIELRNAVALHGTVLRVFRPLLMLILQRIDSARLRYERLLNRPGPNLPRIPKPRAKRPSKPQPVRLPAGFGWLRKIIVNTPKSFTPLNGIRQTFGQLMTDATITAIIKSDPGFARIFRPLCHMLGLPPEPALRLPHHPAPRPLKPIKPPPRPAYPPPPPPPIVIPPDTSVMAYFFPQIYRT